MSGIVWIVAALGVAYLAVAALVRWGTFRSGSAEGRGAANARVSVVIAARDEEPGLPRTLESLRNQTYPTDRYDVTVVDDRSQDGTALLVREAAQGWRGLKLVQVKECPANLGGKQHALAAGIETTSGEVILMTDADCIVPPTWVESVARAFLDDVGVVAGLATFRAPRSFWARLQQADLAHLVGTAWGFIGLGLPFSAIGNNLAVRRAAYEEIGGYRALGFTIAEDCALLRRIAATTGWKTAVAPPSAAVLTEPSPTVRAFLRQRARWASAVWFLRGWTLAFLVLVFLQRVGTLGITVLAATGSVPWLWLVAVWSAWIAGDALVVTRMSGALHERRMARYSPLVTLWQAVYQPVVGLWVLFASKRVTWRGSAYTRAR